MNGRLAVVGVMGSGTSEHAGLAEPLGEALACMGVHLLTGGGGGVMAAASRAFASVEGRAGLVIGVLPGVAGGMRRAGGSGEVSPGLPEPLGRTGGPDAPGEPAARAETRGTRGTTSTSCPRTSSWPCPAAPAPRPRSRWRFATGGPSCSSAVASGPGGCPAAPRTRPWRPSWRTCWPLCAAACRVETARLAGGRRPPGDSGVFPAPTGRLVNPPAADSAASGLGEGARASRMGTAGGGTRARFPHRRTCGVCAWMGRVAGPLRGVPPGRPPSWSEARRSTNAGPNSERRSCRFRETARARDAKALESAVLRSIDPAGALGALEGDGATGRPRSSANRGPESFRWRIARARCPRWPRVSDIHRRRSPAGAPCRAFPCAKRLISLARVFTVERLAEWSRQPSGVVAVALRILEPLELPSAGARDVRRAAVRGARAWRGALRRPCGLRDAQCGGLGAEPRRA